MKDNENLVEMFLLGPMLSTDFTRAMEWSIYYGKEARESLLQRLITLAAQEGLPVPVCWKTLEKVVETKENKTFFGGNRIDVYCEFHINLRFNRALNVKEYHTWRLILKGCYASMKVAMDNRRR